jgi:hypothetical protein
MLDSWLPPVHRMKKRILEENNITLKVLRFKVSHMMP